METILFWIAWGLISFWALKTFYFSYDKERLDKLRKIAFGINLSVIILFFLSWLPPAQGGYTGWELIQQGNLLVILLFGLIASSTLIFLAGDKSLLKVGSIIHITSSIVFIVAMVSLMPKTFSLTLNSIAPIIAGLLLLIGNVIVLLFWQQLQLKDKRRS